MLHIYSSSKIALILFFRNKMKSHKKISFFGFHLLGTHEQHKWQLEVRYFILQNKKMKKKKCFSAIWTKSKNAAFSLLFGIHVFY